MKIPRCTKCKHFRRTRAKTRVYDHGNGISQVAPSLVDALCTYYCKNRWWNVESRSFFMEGDVCEDFEFKTNKQ